MVVSEMAHPATEAVMRWLNYDHLSGIPREVSSIFYDAAHELVDQYGLEGPEVTTGVRKLLEAKDCFVRASLA